ncbi:MAG: hypothetical protein JNM13_15890 [Hyphomicrobiaceae bacterium]|nr:hypothetical protein [Hyphomicrobiaceae bacterium]
MADAGLFAELIETFRTSSDPIKALLIVSPQLTLVLVVRLLRRPRRLPPPPPARRPPGRDSWEDPYLPSPEIQQLLDRALRPR